MNVNEYALKKSLQTTKLVVNNVDSLMSENYDNQRLDNSVYVYWTKRNYRTT
jgi:hypothetical protein